jgi:erythromycin esterase-like protein
MAPRKRGKGKFRGNEVKVMTRIGLALLLGAASAAAAAQSGSPLAAEAQALQQAAGSHRLILLGEMHGTREAPAFASELAGRYSEAGPLVLALEIHQSEQAAIDGYLASPGAAEDRARLLAGAFWQWPLAKNDGRRNAAAVALIDDARRLRAEGREVRVLAMDALSSGSDNQARDDAMATLLRAEFEKLPPEGRMLVLTGNVHAMRRKPLFAPPEMQVPMGSRLADLDVYSVDITATHGSFWGCMDLRCGPNRIHSRPPGSGPREDQPWDYDVVLPEYTVPKMIAEGKEQP